MNFNITDKGQNTGVSFASVTDAAALNALIDGEDTPGGCARLASYSPAKGDRVVVLHAPGTRVILGKVV